jgi:hypothetical protein
VVSPVLGTPTVTQPLYRDGNVVATWNGVDNAAGYEALFIDTNRTIAGPAQILGADVRGARFPLTSGANPASTADMLFAGVGFAQIGSTFAIS